MTRHRMSAADAAWLRMDRPQNLMVVTSVMWFDRPVPRADLEAVLRERMVEKFPRFSQRVVDEHGLHWEDVEDFDIADHVHEVTLPHPAGREELERFVGEQVSVPLSWDRPLWDLYVIDEYGEGSATVFRMHHAVADGFSLVRVLMSLTDDPTARPVDIAPAGDYGGWTDMLAKVVRRSFGVVTSPGRLLGMANPLNLIDLAQSVVADGTAAGKLLLLPPDHNTALRGRIGIDKRTVWTEPIPFDTVKQTAKASGVTINDLLLAAVAGGLRTYLVRRRSRVADLRAIVPFNLRPLDKPLPADLGNRFGLVYLALPVTVATREERVAEMHRRMTAIKDSAEGVVAYGILEAVGMVPLQLEKLAIDIFASKGTGVMTNVPGPRNPVTMAGARLLGTIGWGPTSGNLGLGVAIFSYAGTITVGFCVDSSLVPDPEVLRADFMDELDLLLDPARV